MQSIKPKLANGDPRTGDKQFFKMPIAPTNRAEAGYCPHFTARHRAYETTAKRQYRGAPPDAR